MTGYETAFHKALQEWLDGRIAELTDAVTNGSQVVRGDVATTAMNYQACVFQIQALRAVRAQAHEIGRRLSA